MVDHRVLPSSGAAEMDGGAATGRSRSGAEDRWAVWRRIGGWRVHPMGRARRDGEPDEFTWRWIRGAWVLRDKAVAQLLGEQTRVLNQWVSRNPHWFPEDLAFWLEPAELGLYFTDVEFRFSGPYVRPPRVFTSAGLLQLRLRRRPEDALPLVRSLAALLPLAESAARLTDLRFAAPPGSCFTPSRNR